MLGALVEPIEALFTVYVRFILYLGACSLCLKILVSTIHRTVVCFGYYYCMGIKEQFG